MKRTILAFLFILTGLGLWAGGGSDRASGSALAGGQKTLRVGWWGGDLRHKNTLAVIDLFKKANPGLEVLTEYSGFDAYFEKLAVQTAGGNAPDVQQFGMNYPEYVAKDALLELDKYRGNLFDDSKFDKGVLDAGTMNGHLYAICLGTNTRCLVYNKTMLEKAGIPLPKEMMTWEELRSYCLSIAPKLPAGVYPLADMDVSDFLALSYFLRQEGSALYRNGTSPATVAQLQKWLQMWDGFRKEKIILDAEGAAASIGVDISATPLVLGKVAIGYYASNQLANLQALMTDELALLPLPDQQKRAGWFQPSQNMCIGKKSRLPDDAMKFINFFVNDPEAGKILGNERGVSSSETVRGALAPLASPLDKKVYELYSIISPYTASPDPEILNQTEFTNNKNNISQNIAWGNITVAQGAQELYDLIQRLLVKK